MSICIYKGETGPKGATYKRHNIDKITGLCKRCEHVAYEAAKTEANSKFLSSVNVDQIINKILLANEKEKS